MKNMDIWLKSKLSVNLLTGTKPVWKDAQIKIVEGCNSRCVTCDIWKKKTVEEMSVKDYGKVLKELKKTGLKSVCLTGGEPLLHSKISDLCRITKEEGLNLVIATNGLLLSNKIEVICDYADQINISIDGWGKTNDEIRGINGYFDIGLKALKKIKNNYPDIKLAISTTITDANFNEVGKLTAWCKKNGIQWGCNLLCGSLYFFRNAQTDGLSVNKGSEVISRWKKNLHGLMSRQTVDYIADFLMGKNKRMPCLLGLVTVYVDHKLNVYSGCYVLPPIGNLRTDSINNIVGSESFKKRIRDMFELNCPGCTCGYDKNLELNNYGGVLADKLTRKLKWKNTT